MSNPKPIPFAEWTPDAGLRSGAAIEAKGVFSHGGRYQPLRSAVSYGAQARLQDRCLGHYAAIQSGGQIVNFFGDRSRLYRMTARVMTDISRPGGYTADGDASWQFDQYNDFVFAAIRGAPLQYIQLGGSGTFVNVGGVAGEADAIGRVGPHMIIAQGRELRISASNAPLDYEPSAETGAGAVMLDQRGGPVHAIIGDSLAASVFQERQISRLTYTGGVTAFDLQAAEANRGCLGPSAVAKLGRLVFYASEDGMWVFDGTQSAPIGANKVDRYFISRLNYAYRNRVSCAIDTDRKCFMVAFPTGSSPDITEQLIYSIPDQRWTRDEFDGQALFEMPREGVSVDDVSAVQALAGTTSVDAISLSVDSPIWRETRKQWGAVDANRYVVLFEGSTRPAVLETSEFEGAPGRQSYVTEVYPLVDAAPASVTARVSTRRHRLDGALVEMSAPMNDHGVAMVRAEGRLMRFRLDVAAAAEWTEARGVHSDMRVTGQR